MKVIFLVSLAFAAASAEGKAVKPQTRASGFTYPSGSTAAYTPQTGLIYNIDTIVKYPAGATMFFPNPVSVSFLLDSNFYLKDGPVNVVAGTNWTFPGNTQVAFPPGTRVKYTSKYAEARHLTFNGNSHTIVQYETEIQAQYYCSDCSNLILYPASTNPLVYYNPGGSTRFGPSALPVEELVKPPITTARTYGYYGGGGGYSYCSGYSYGGYPQTTYYNYNTGYQSTCYQTGYNSYSYGGGGGGGGYSMAGGSCYGGGSYYGGGGGGGGGYGK